MIEGVQIIDRDFRYHYVNKTVAAHAKLSVDQLQGYKMVEVFPGIDTTQVYKVIESCMDSRENFEMIN